MEQILKIEKDKDAWYPVDQESIFRHFSEGMIAVYDPAEMIAVAEAHGWSVVKVLQGEGE